MQSHTVNNDCLNPILDSNTIDNVVGVGVGNCGGTVSQQDESGQASAPTTHQTANPTIELQRATTTTQPPLTGESCEECIDMLNPTQQEAIEQFLASGTAGLGPEWPTEMTTIKEVCKAWESFSQDHREDADGDLAIILGAAHLPESTFVSIVRCFDRAVG